MALIDGLSTAGGAARRPPTATGVQPALATRPGPERHAPSAGSTKGASLPPGITLDHIPFIADDAILSDDAAQAPNPESPSGPVPVQKAAAAAWQASLSILRPDATASLSPKADTPIRPP